MNSKSTNDKYYDDRIKMIKTQLIPRGIKNKSVLNAIKTVPRHLFIPEKYISEAYSDNPVQIGYNQTISQPYMVASMSELLNPESASRILEIGTGCGYQSAVLAEIVSEVFTVEIIEELHLMAMNIFEKLHYQNIKSKHDDGAFGWPEYAPFDGIIITAATPKIPEALIDQLAPGGTMILPFQEPYHKFQNLIKITKTLDGLVRESLYSVRFVPMTGHIND